MDAEQTPPDRSSACPPGFVVESAGELLLPPGDSVEHVIDHPHDVVWVTGGAGALSLPEDHPRPLDAGTSIELPRVGSVTISAGASEFLNLILFRLKETAP